jgi:cell division protein FtsB
MFRFIFSATLVALSVFTVAPVTFAGGGGATQSEINAQVWANKAEIDKLKDYTIALRRENSALKKHVAELETGVAELGELMTNLEDHNTAVQAALQSQIKDLFTIVDSNWNTFQWIESLVYGLLERVYALEVEVFGKECQPAYDKCDDGDPCTEDWCSPQTSTCQHQLAQECSGK